MSEFFDSDLVKEALEDIHGLQSEIYQNAFKFGTMSRQDKLEHIEKLTSLLEKQKLNPLVVNLPKEEKINFHLQHKVEQIKKNSTNAIVSTLDKEGKKKDFDCDVVLVSVGRKPNTIGLNLI